MGRVAKEIEEATSQGQQADIAYLYDKLGTKFTRKEIADCASSLFKRGYLERIGLGTYNAKQKLHHLVGRGFEKDVDKPKESPSIIIRKKSLDKRKEAEQEKYELDLASFNNLMQRLEDCLGRLEGVIDKLQNQAELEEALDMLEKALAVRKK